MSEKNNTSPKKDSITNPIFRKNLNALFLQDEILVAELFGIKEQKKYEIFIGKNDPLDINYIDKTSYKYLYENPVKDTEKMLVELEKEYKRYPFLYFFGLGNGILYKAMLKNQTHQKIYVFEPELEIIYATLNILDLSEELESERLVLFYTPNTTSNQIYYLIPVHDLLPYAKLYKMLIHSAFYEQFDEEILRINSYFTKFFTQHAYGYGNDIKDTLIGTKYMYQNLVPTLTGYVYKDLILARRKKVKTAVIVATGPSLTKQLGLLKKVAPYVSVICLDASYQILLKNGIKPDYVTSIERVTETSKFFEVSDKRYDKDTYFVIASLTHPQTVKNLQDRRLLLAIRPNKEGLLYNPCEYGFLGIGHSTANQAFQLACVLQHENIILIGQDLAYAKDGSSHATGHLYPLGKDKENLKTEAYGGDGEVYTTHVWNLFKTQYEKDIEESNKNNIKTYNCTEGGARIKGTIEKPFKEMVDEILANDKRKKLPLIKKPNKQRVNKALLYFYKIMNTKLRVQIRCKNMLEKAFLKITPRVDKLMELKKLDQINESHLDELIAISEIIDVVKQKLMKPKTAKYIEDMLNVSISPQERELARIAVAPAETKMQKVNKLLEWVEIHKYWLFSAAGGISADIETTQVGEANLANELKKRKIFPKAKSPRKMLKKDK
ncbi:MAG: DUF115 domain-containing protein [Campylobacter sp.]|nr:DUF115 domain-containing protein [Campylobacter sp.]